MTDPVGLTALAAVPDTPFTGWLVYILENQSEFWQLLADHAMMVVFGELAAILVAVPAGIAATRNPLASKVVTNLANVSQTIPPLAVIALSFTTLGLGYAPAVLAIFIYALLPIVKNTVAGIESVDDGMVRAGRGMGLSVRERLRLVELPLALPIIFAGIRTSTVLCIGVAYLGAFISAGGFGQWIIMGTTTINTDIMLAGAIPGALLVIGIDRLFVYAEGALTPEGVVIQQSDDQVTA